MKIKFLSVVVAFFGMLLLVTSCLDSDDIILTYPDDSSIHSFAIKDIKTTIIRGKDTIKFTVDGDHYPFSIDQQRLIIYNPDSLPFNTNVSKVVLNITTSGGPVYYMKNGKDTLWTTTDSLNFTKAVSIDSPIIFTAFSPDLQTSWKYKVWLNVHKQLPDSLVWGQIKETDFQGSLITGKQKSVCLENKVYVFAEVSSQVEVTSTSINDGKTWTRLTALEGINGKADCSSVIVFDNKLFIVADEQVYSSVNGINWTSVSVPGSNIKTLITSFTNSPVASTRLYAQDKKLIGISEDHIVQSATGAEWKIVGSVSADFPIDNFASTSAYITNTNSDIERSVVVGTVNANDTAAVVWSILSNENTYTQLSPSQKSTNNCPKLTNLSVIYYDGMLYAFGGKSANNDIKAFQTFFSSRDGGLSWQKVTKNILFPSEFLGRNENFSYVIDQDNYLWIMWSGTGEVWKGRVNRLGFIK